MTYVQQGDCIVMAIESFPEGERILDDQAARKILAYGEVTGHSHAISDEENACTVFRILNKLYIETSKPVALKHEEHDTIIIPPGKHEVRIVIEADHISGVVRRVAD